MKLLGSGPMQGSARLSTCTCPVNRGGASTPDLSINLIRPSNESQVSLLTVLQGLNRVVLGSQHAQNTKDE